MPNHYPFLFPLTNGLHARPASYIAEVTSRFAATFTFKNERTGRVANGKSVLGLIATDTRLDDPCWIDASGPDQKTAIKELKTFLNGPFKNCDPAFAVGAIETSKVTIPRSLIAAGLGQYCSGRIACRGLGWGTVVLAKSFILPASLLEEGGGDVEAEQLKFEQALGGLVTEMKQQSATEGAIAAEVIKAHIGILRDPEFLEHVAAAIRQGLTAGQAIGSAVDINRTMLGQAESVYVRERVLDLDEIALRLLGKIYGHRCEAPPIALTAPSILVAENLTPGQFLALDRRLLRGLVLEHGGQTSHTVILAKSFDIPTLTGVAGALAVMRPGAVAIVDAHLGIALSEIGRGVRQYYEREETKLARLVAVVRAGPVRTKDGRQLEIGANVASIEEAVAAFERGADGIGLLRTELLFAGHSVAPTENEQYAIYAAVVRAAGGRPVIVRTLDVGGDKPVPFLSFPREKNPFLGYRGVRFYSEQSALIKTQLRSLVRAGAHGPLNILIPMVACVEEARLVRRLLEEVRAELRADGVEGGADVKLGFMLEIPAVAFALEELCAEADFFSIGTNDLAQYFLAADRENPKVASLYSPLYPSFIRILKHLVDGVHARGRWIGLCGELAEQDLALPLLVGLGFDEISLASPRIAAAKAAVTQLDTASCVTLVERLLRLATRGEVEQALTMFCQVSMPLIAPELILVDVEARTKEDVIHEMVDSLHLSGRTNCPAAVEDAIWRREDTYSTGFGDGFALPHCKSADLKANSIVVARLRHPVEWHAVDAKPVDIVIMLGIRGSEHGSKHMETIARLSRLLMQDDFRARLRNEVTTADLVALLRQALDLTPVEATA